MLLGVAGLVPGEYVPVLRAGAGAGDGGDPTDALGAGLLGAAQLHFQPAPGVLRAAGARRHGHRDGRRDLGYRLT